jgi:hypothetical protein
MRFLQNRLYSYGLGTKRYSHLSLLLNLTDTNFVYNNDSAYLTPLQSEHPSIIVAGRYYVLTSYAKLITAAGIMGQFTSKVPCSSRAIKITVPKRTALNHTCGLWNVTHVHEQANARASLSIIV